MIKNMFKNMYDLSNVKEKMPSKSKVKRVFLDKENILKLCNRDKAKVLGRAIRTWEIHSVQVDPDLTLFSFDFIFPCESKGNLKGTYYYAFADADYEVTSYISTKSNDVYTMAFGGINAFDINGQIKYRLRYWDGKFVNVDVTTYPIAALTEFVNLLEQIENGSDDTELDVAELIIQEKKYYRVNYTDKDGNFRSVMINNDAKILDITILKDKDTYILKNFKFDRKLPKFIKYATDEDSYKKLQNLGLAK